MIKYIKEVFSSKEQQCIANAKAELKAYRADKVRLIRSLAMTQAAVIANDAAIEALEACIPEMETEAVVEVESRPLEAQKAMAVFAFGSEPTLSYK